MYDEAIQQCNQLLMEKNLSPELQGRCYNLKGMINIYQSNDLNSALENFKNAKSQFVESNQPVRIAGAEVNIGNVYNILSNYKKAEEHWQNASHINQSIGNLEQEGMLLQNIGLFYIERNKYDLAIQSYLKAQRIFLSLGKEVDYGLILINLGEVYLRNCDYQKSLNHLVEAIKIFNRLNIYEEISESLTLVGKLYYSLGFVVKLEETIKSIEKIRDKTKVPPKYFINAKYLNFLLQLLKSQKVNANDIMEIMIEYKKIGERNLMTECMLIIIRILINEKNYEVAYKKLMNEELIEICSQNSILEAQREYFLGIISKNIKSDKLLPPLVYFEKAYDLIRDEYINELTWKVLFEISELYIERGNLTKAKYFVTYTRELIYFIAEKIESPHLRAAYLRNRERMNTLKKLESFYPSN
jgi:tetratricopeptide (TPR) repeat protein